MRATCPSCQAGIEISAIQSEINHRLACPQCSVNLEVTWLYPFTLDLIDDPRLKNDLPLQQETNQN